MKGIKFVKVITTKTPVEPFLIEVKKKFVFKGEYFEVCDTIEEIRDKFYEDLNPDEVVEFIEVYTYKTRKDLDKCKQYEALAE